MAVTAATLDAARRPPLSERPGQTDAATLRAARYQEGLPTATVSTTNQKLNRLGERLGKMTPESGASRGTGWWTGCSGLWRQAAWGHAAARWRPRRHAVMHRVAGQR